MSAWIVSKQHIDLLVAGVLENGGYEHKGTFYPVTLDDANDVGQMLWAENHRSIRYRYGSHERCPQYFYRAPAKYQTTSKTIGDTTYLEPQTRVNPGVLAKQIACYDYQTCEHPTYTGSKPHSIVSSLCRALIHNVEGYEDASWGV